MFSTIYGLILFIEKYLKIMNVVSDSDSDSGEYEEVITNIFYSAYGGKSKGSPVDDVLPTGRNSQSHFILSLNIQEGMLSVNPPWRDGSSNVIPGKCSLFASFSKPFEYFRRTTGRTFT